MRDIAAELKQLRLNGMVGAWTDLIEKGKFSLRLTVSSAIVDFNNIF